MCTRICNLDCHEAGMCCHLVIRIETYYIHYSCFTAICDLFTDCSSYVTNCVVLFILLDRLCGLEVRDSIPDPTRFSEK
jgi:hypothetical protein